MRLATGCTNGLPLKRTISDVLPGGVLEEEVGTRYNVPRLLMLTKQSRDTTITYIHTMCVSLPLTTLTSSSTISHQANSSFMNCSVHWDATRH